jgi:hypothetical protein
MKNKMEKPRTREAKITSHLMKDIRRIRKHAEKQMRMNTLRKYQIRKLNDFLNKLLKEERITKNELREYMPKKKDAEKKLFNYL